MKKVILASTLSVICLSSFAQTDSSRKNNNMNPNQNQNKNPGGTQYQQNNTNNECTVRMDNGKVMLLVDGREVTVDKDTTLTNGTIVKKNGRVKIKEGKTVTLKDGDCIDDAGNMVVARNSEIKKGSGTH